MSLMPRVHRARRQGGALQLRRRRLRGRRHEQPDLARLHRHAQAARAGGQRSAGGRAGRGQKFGAILFVGGQAPMVTLERAAALHTKFVECYTAGKAAAAPCHGSAILRYARLPNGELLAKGKTVTGFANVEEDFADHAVWSYGLLARDTHAQPWRIEDELKALGANYVQAGPWRSFAVRDGNLVTGQQNFSGAATAERIVRALGE